MLKPGDPQQRLDFANEFLLRYDADNNWPLRIFWTDEAHFDLNSNVNTENCVHWADTNPHAVALASLYVAKLTVWCDISGTVLLGPYFFEETTPTYFVTCFDRLLLYSYAAKLYHTRTASAKCTE